MSVHRAQRMREPHSILAVFVADVVMLTAHVRPCDRSKLDKKMEMVGVFSALGPLALESRQRCADATSGC